MTDPDPFESPGRGVFVSVIVPTRNRPAELQHCLESLASVSYPRWETIVVDQSDDTDSEVVTQSFSNHLPGLRYVRMSGPGLSRSRNLGLEDAAGEIIAFLDDDCVVAVDWLETVVAAFARHPLADLVFGAVVSGLDPERYYVPQYLPSAEHVLHGWFGAVHSEGIGAAMYLRRTALARFGPFDPYLGAGAHFFSSEEGDYACRILSAGGTTVQTPKIRVIHLGGREYRTGAASRLLRAAAFSHGAAHMKLLRSGRLVGLVLIALHLWTYVWMVRPWNAILRRGPTRAAWIIMYTRGLLASFQCRVDRAKRLYVALAGAQVLWRPVDLSTILPRRKQPRPTERQPVGRPR